MRLGVIGWGLRKTLAKQAHSPDRGRTLVALCDPNPQAKEDFREFAGADAMVTDSIEALLQQKLDAVFVLSPDYLHESHAIATLSAGVPTYLEKPMAITVAGCDAIVAAQAKSGTPLFVGHNMREFDIVREMKAQIMSGAIGKVKAAWCRHFVSYGGEAYFRDWHADRSKSTGLLLQKGSHDIDILHHLCGGFTVRTAAFGALAVYGENADRMAEGETLQVAFDQNWPPATMPHLNHTVDVEDLNMMLMELDNGVLASYQQCHFSPDAWRNYTVIGDAGRIENVGDAPGNATVKIWNTRKDAYRATADIEIDIPVREGSHGGADALVLERFFQVLAGDESIDRCVIAGRMAVAAGIAATESVRSGGIPIDVAKSPIE